MASITLGGNPIHTNGELPKVGSKATDFNLVKTDLGTATLADFAGYRIVTVTDIVISEKTNF